MVILRYYDIKILRDFEIHTYIRTYVYTCLSVARQVIAVVRCRISQQEHRQAHRYASHTHSLHVHRHHEPLVTLKAYVCLLLTSAHVTRKCCNSGSSKRSDPQT